MFLKVLLKKIITAPKTVDNPAIVESNKGNNEALSIIFNLSIILLHNYFMTDGK